VEGNLLLLLPSIPRFNGRNRPGPRPLSYLLCKTAFLICRDVANLSFGPLFRQRKPILESGVAFSCLACEDLVSVFIGRPGPSRINFSTPHCKVRNSIPRGNGGWEGGTADFQPPFPSLFPPSLWNKYSEGVLQPPSDCRIRFFSEFFPPPLFPFPCCGRLW